MHEGDLKDRMSIKNLAIYIPPMTNNMKRMPITWCFFIPSSPSQEELSTYEIQYVWRVFLHNQPFQNHQKYIIKFIIFERDIAYKSLVFIIQGGVMDLMEIIQVLMYYVEIYSRSKV